MILYIIFTLILISDILEILMVLRFKKNQDKSEWAHTLFLIATALFSVLLLSRIFKVNMKYTIYLLMISFNAVLLMMSYSLKQVKNQYEFEELSQYMLRICVYYRSHQKIYPALTDAMDGFNGKFKRKCEHVTQQFDSGVSLEEAMQTFEQHYLLKSLVKILESSESIGHLHSDAQLTRLEYDIENWIFQTKAYQLEEKKMRQRMILLFGVGLMISYFAQNMLLQSVDMKSHNTYQQLIFMFLGSNIIAVVMLSRRLCQSWYLSKEFL